MSTMMMMMMMMMMCVVGPDSPSLSPTSYLGLLDRTRMFLCLFMITLFIFNPFAGVVKLGRGFPVPTDNTGRAAGRTLLSDDSEAGTYDMPQRRVLDVCCIVLSLIVRMFGQVCSQLCHCLVRCDTIVCI